MLIDEPSLSYNDLTLVPQTLDPGSRRIYSRSQINTELDMFKGTWAHKPMSIPFLNSPMDSICSVPMYEALSKAGLIPVTHRFQSIESHVQQVRDFNHVSRTFSANNPYRFSHLVLTIGADPKDFIPRAKALIEADSIAKLWLIDIANGYSPVIERPIKWLYDHVDNPFIIAGNVCTASGYEYLASLGVQALRVGIGSGSACTTRVQTGCGLGQASAIMDVVLGAESMDPKTKPLIIADGGIRSSGDMAKALALGADLVMGGRVLAGTLECPQWALKSDKAIYRGMASVQVMKENNLGFGEKLHEGEEIRVARNGSVADVVRDLGRGLRSAMSYMNASNLEEFREKAILRTVTPSSYTEGLPQWQ